MRTKPTRGEGGRREDGCASVTPVRVARVSSFARAWVCVQCSCGGPTPKARSAIRRWQHHLASTAPRKPGRQPATSLARTRPVKEAPAPALQTGPAPHRRGPEGDRVQDRPCWLAPALRGAPSRLCLCGYWGGGARGAGGAHLAVATRDRRASATIRFWNSRMICGATHAGTTQPVRARQQAKAQLCHSAALQRSGRNQSTARSGSQPKPHSAGSARLALALASRTNPTPAPNRYTRRGTRNQKQPKGACAGRARPVCCARRRGCLGAGLGWGWAGRGTTAGPF